METVQLIETLAKAAKPVRPMCSPFVRTGNWLLVGLAILLLLAAGHGLRPDITGQLQTPSFVVGTVASLLTGALAALGCLVASLPDRSRSWLLLPLPAFVVWLATLGHGCLTDWVSYDVGSLKLGGAVRCFATVLLVSLPLSASMFVMLRHVARLRPALVTLAAGLAVAGVTSTFMSLLYRLDATIMNLTWNLGTTAVIVAIEASVGRRVLSGLAFPARIRSRNTTP